MPGAARSWSRRLALVAALASVVTGCGAASVDPDDGADEDILASAEAVDGECVWKKGEAAGTRLDGDALEKQRWILNRVNDEQAFDTRPMSAMRRGDPVYVRLDSNGDYRAQVFLDWVGMTPSRAIFKRRDGSYRLYRTRVDGRYVIAMKSKDSNVCHLRGMRRASTPSVGYFLYVNHRWLPLKNVEPFRGQEHECAFYLDNAPGAAFGCDDHVKDGF